ncbi:MAG: glycosyltransferase family 4 protein [Nitrospirae bacterium]|nr:glycosyltransferase family 4 protein [Nitrospirota bacterium]
MKILLFSYDFPPKLGGIATYTTSLGAEFARQGHEVHGVCPGSPSDPGLPGLHLYRFDATGSNLRRYLRGCGALEEAVDRVRPDVVHATSSMAHLALGRVECGGIPKIMTVHGTEIRRNLCVAGRRHLRDRIFRPSYLATNRIICVSRFTRSLAEDRGLPQDKLAVIYNGVDTSPHYHPPEDLSDLRSRFDLFGKKIILTIAHLHPRKGQAEVLHALPDVLRRVPDAVYVMVGSGDALEELRWEARAKGVDDAVRFCGDAVDARSFHAIADVLVQFSLPSGAFIEGFGLSVAEAMVEGVPVVVSDTGGLPEVVEHEKSGIVVPHDHPEHLASAIIRILSNRDEARRWGRAGRQRALSRFPLDRFARETLAVYEEIR